MKLFKLLLIISMGLQFYASMVMGMNARDDDKIVTARQIQEWACELVEEYAWFDHQQSQSAVSTGNQLVRVSLSSNLNLRPATVLGAPLVSASSSGDPLDPTTVSFRQFRCDLGMLGSMPQQIYEAFESVLNALAIKSTTWFEYFKDFHRMFMIALRPLHEDKEFDVFVVELSSWYEYFKTLENMNAKNIVMTPDIVKALKKKACTKFLEIFGSKVAGREPYRVRCTLPREDKRLIVFVPGSRTKMLVKVFHYT